MDNFLRIDMELHKARGYSDEVGDLLNNMMNEQDSKIKKVFDTVASDFASLAQSRGDAYRTLSMGIGTQEIKGMLGRLEEAVSEIK